MATLGQLGIRKTIGEIRDWFHRHGVDVKEMDDAELIAWVAILKEGHFVPKGDVKNFLDWLNGGDDE